jgi:hypothetical protein
MLQTTDYRSFPIVDNVESMTFLGSIRRMFLERALERALQYNQVCNFLVLGKLFPKYSKIKMGTNYSRLRYAMPDVEPKLRTMLYHYYFYFILFIFFIIIHIYVEQALGFTLNWF